MDGAAAGVVTWVVAGGATCAEVTMAATLVSTAAIEVVWAGGIAAGVVWTGGMAAGGGGGGTAAGGIAAGVVWAGGGISAGGIAAGGGITAGGIAAWAD
jgi:hypothetical protein